MNFYKLPIFFITCGVIILNGCASIHSHEDREVIYKWKNGNLVHVFNTANMLFSEEDVEYLARRNGVYSEFGGNFRFCNSEKYLCVVGGVAAAVPRNMSGQTDWVYENWICQSKQPIYKKEIVSISCSYKGQVTDFKYSSLQGVISYTNRGKATIKEMELMGGNIGLLAKN